MTLLVSLPLHLQHDLHFKLNHLGLNNTINGNNLRIKPFIYPNLLSTHHVLPCCLRTSIHNGVNPLNNPSQERRSESRLQISEHHQQLPHHRLMRQTALMRRFMNLFTQLCCAYFSTSPTTQVCTNQQIKTVGHFSTGLTRPRTVGRQ